MHRHPAAIIVIYSLSSLILIRTNDIVSPSSIKVTRSISDKRLFDCCLTATVTANLFTVVLRQPSSVRRSLSHDALPTLLRAFVDGKVDYCNSVLACVSGTLLRLLQSVLSAVARLVSARRFEHVAPIFLEHHWLGVPERIYTLSRSCVLAYTAVFTAPHRHTSQRPCTRRLAWTNMSTSSVS
jgi:hypothetical protein